MTRRKPQFRRKRTETNKPRPFPKIRLAALATRAYLQMDFTKLKSRKLWIAVGTAAIVALLTGIGVSEDVTTKLVALASSYVIGQGIADHGAGGGSQGGGE